VLVTDPAGNIVKNRDAAAREAALRLKFADGTLDVATGSAPPPRPARAKSSQSGGQQELF